MKLDSKLIVLVMLIGLSCVSCLDSPDMVECQKFKLETSENGVLLNVRIDTDLPDDTLVVVSVSRVYKEVGNPATYSIDYFSDKSQMRNWKVGQNITLSDVDWKESLKKKQVEMSRLGYGFDVASISDKIEVYAVVPIGQENPRFGFDNQYLTGVAVRSDGQTRTVHAKVLVKRPMKKTPIGKSTIPSLNPLDLEVGATYTVKKITPVMPHYNSSNPSLAMRKIKYLEGGDSFRVVKKRIANGAMWYQVIGLQRPTNKKMNGWIKGIALLGQNLDGTRHP